MDGVDEMKGGRRTERDWNTDKKNKEGKPENWSKVRLKASEEDTGIQQQQIMVGSLLTASHPARVQLRLDKVHSPPKHEN